MIGFQERLWLLASRDIMRDQLHNLEESVKRLRSLILLLPEGRSRHALASEINTLNETADTLRQALSAF